MASTTWYWGPKHCICQSSSDTEILQFAIDHFAFQWTYATNGNGQAIRPNMNNPNDVWYQTNCWYLVRYSLDHLGYDNAYVPPSFPLGQLPDRSLQTYSCKVPIAQAQPGDLALWCGGSFQGSHIDIIVTETPKVVANSAGWRVDTWGAQGYLSDPPDLADTGIGGRSTDVDASGRSNRGLLEVWRPKRCQPSNRYPHKPPNKPLGQAPPDPLIFDLNGGGIQTVGLNAGIHFDQDSNGFKELSGWVAPGDGMLMLDKNGNGRLDDGSELFGEFTILPNGLRADNGFEALADLDSNHDGKIDANDAAFSQLRVWKDADGDGYSLTEELHTRTAQMLRLASRDEAKPINFGIIFGQGPKALAREITASWKEQGKLGRVDATRAQGYIDTFFDTYKRILPYFDEEYRKLTGPEVSDRVLKNPVTSRIRRFRRRKSDKLMREMKATLLQQVESHLLKLSLLKIGGEISKIGLDARMVACIHDSIWVETPLAEEADVREIMETVMTTAMSLSVPLSLDFEATASPDGTASMP